MDQDKSQSSESQGLPAPAAAKPAMSRRAMLRAGAAATPVLLTLASGPVAAAGSSCTVASSFVSAATFASRNPGQTYVQCASMGPKDWLSYHCSNENQLSHSPYRTILSQTVQLRLCDTGNHAYNAMKCKDLLVNDHHGIASAGPVAVLQNLVSLALSLDATPSLITNGGSLNKAYLIGVWNNYKTTGGYHLPASGINWSETQLLTFLRALQQPIPVASIA
jgi:hypothetical protein